MNALQNVAVMAARRGGAILIRHLNKLDKVTYIKFKSAIMLASKALTYLARQKQKAGP